MIFDSILNNIGKHVQLSAAEADDFCSLLSVRQLKKKEFLVRIGEISYHESYINKGCFRNYILDKEGGEHNFYFAVEDWWVSDIHSRTFKLPSFANVVALEDSEIVQISQLQLDQYMLEVPKLERFFRITYQRSMAGHQRRLLQQICMTAEERYIAFRTNYPQFDQRIPQKHIASYLGLTPEFFSSIRTKVIRGS